MIHDSRYTSRPRKLYFHQQINEAGRRPSSANLTSESDSILMAIVSGPCQTPRKHANAGKEDPRLGARDCFLEILGESRRHRLSQASVRSIPQRLGSALNVPTLCDRVTISMTHLPNSAIAAGSCFPR